jgi:hypothetical protein
MTTKGEIATTGKRSRDDRTGMSFREHARNLSLVFFFPDITEFAAGEHPQAYDL